MMVHASFFGRQLPASLAVSMRQYNALAGGTVSQDGQHLFRAQVNERSYKKMLVFVTMRQKVPR